MTPRPATRRWRRFMLGLALGAVSTAALALPGAAVLQRLTTLPLGKGTATVSWAYKPSSLNPAPTRFKGSARGLTITGINRPPRLGTDTGGTLPTTLTIANITGTLDGSPFTVKVSFSTAGLITPSSVASTLVGQVTGTFRNQPLSATLGASLRSNTVTFRGHIGSDAITGRLSGATRRGKTVTAHATFDLTH